MAQDKIYISTEIGYYEEDEHYELSLPWNTYVLNLSNYKGDEYLSVVVQAVNEDCALAVAYQYLACEWHDFMLSDDIHKVDDVLVSLAQSKAIDNPKKIIDNIISELKAESNDR